MKISLEDIKIQHGKRIGNVACELELMLARLSPEEQERIRTKADNLEVLFKGNAVCVKNKDENWCDGIFNDEYTDNETTEEKNNEKH